MRRDRVNMGFSFQINFKVKKVFRQLFYHFNIEFTCIFILFCFGSSGGKHICMRYLCGDGSADDTRNETKKKKKKKTRTPLPPIGCESEGSQREGNCHEQMIQELYPSQESVYDTLQTIPSSRAM